jgi:hypothetical protein
MLGVDRVRAGGGYTTLVIKGAAGAFLGVTKVGENCSADCIGIAVQPAASDLPYLMPAASK